MSKHLFELMQAQELETRNFLPNKKEIQIGAKKFITDVLEKGECNKYELLAQARRLAEALEVINTELLNVLPQENFEEFGLKGTFKNGGEVLNYSEDHIVSELEKKLAQRKELVKTATKSDEPIYDSDGVEVTKVSSTQRKSSLSISF